MKGGKFVQGIGWCLLSVSAGAFLCDQELFLFFVKSAFLKFFWLPIGMCLSAIVLTLEGRESGKL